MNIQFSKGATRYVILYSDKAVKIGKIRPLRVISAIFEVTFSRRRRCVLRERHGNNPFIAVWNALFAGVLINRREFSYYQQSRDERVMPTMKSFLFGLVIIQERGAKVSPSEFENHNPLRKILHLLHGTDLVEPRQYCFDIKGKLRLVDFGDSQTVALLQSSLEKQAA